MNTEILASFLAGTIVTAIINKIWDVCHKERSAILKKDAVIKNIEAEMVSGGEISNTGLDMFNNRAIIQLVLDAISRLANK